MLTDLRLGDGSGAQVCRLASELEIPAVLMTGLATRGEVAEAVNAGASCVLEKPFALDRLIELIEAQIAAASPDAMVRRAYRKMSRSG